MPEMALNVSTDSDLISQIRQKLVNQTQIPPPSHQTISQRYRWGCIVATRSPSTAVIAPAIVSSTLAVATGARPTFPPPENSCCCRRNRRRQRIQPVMPRIRSRFKSSRCLHDFQRVLVPARGSASRRGAFNQTNYVYPSCGGGGGSRHSTVDDTRAVINSDENFAGHR